MCDGNTERALLRVDIRYDNCELPETSLGFDMMDMMIETVWFLNDNNNVDDTVGGLLYMFRYIAKLMICPVVG